MHLKNKKAILILVFTRRREIRKCVKLKLFKKRSSTQMINRCQADFMLVSNFLEINIQLADKRILYVHNMKKFMSFRTESL